MLKTIQKKDQKTQALNLKFLPNRILQKLNESIIDSLPTIKLIKKGQYLILDQENATQAEEDQENSEEKFPKSKSLNIFGTVTPSHALATPINNLTQKFQSISKLLSENFSPDTEQQFDYNNHIRKLEKKCPIKIKSCRRYGITYRGEYHKNKKNGSGVEFAHDQSFYIGNFENGKREKLGSIFHNTGTPHYKGQNQNGNKHGFGMQYDKRGNIIYIGFHENGEKFGKGCKYYSGTNGNYDGQWKSDKKDGQGKYYYGEEGDVYQGQWNNDMIHGFGKYAWADGSYYEGEHHCDTFNGFGVMRYSDGFVYKGRFENDVRNGYGKLYNDKGELVDQGNYIDDVLVREVFVEIDEEGEELLEQNFRN